MGDGENDFRRDRAMPRVAARDEMNSIPPPLVGSGLSRIISKSRGGIGLRLLAGVLLFSSVVTLALTALQLYLEYEREVGVIESRLDEIGRSYPDSLGESLWNLDQNQLELQLKGILSLPDVEAVEIRELANRPNPVRLARGQHATRSMITREYPLDYVMQGSRRQIGVLRVEATLTEVYRQLLNRALVILASQAAKTFLVSFFILYLFHLLVTRHLAAIAEFVSGYNLANPPPPLRLNRRPPREADELDKVRRGCRDGAEVQLQSRCSLRSREHSGKSEGGRDRGRSRNPACSRDAQQKPGRRHVLGGPASGNPE